MADVGGRGGGRGGGGALRSERERRWNEWKMGDADTQVGSVRILSWGGTLTGSCWPGLDFAGWWAARWRWNGLAGIR